MISSFKKIALDQKVSKLLQAQNHDQNPKSGKKLVKAKTTPQTTKYINHKCQIKKNLFHQQKQNIPQGLYTIKFQTVADQKQKTIKFITEKSLNQKRENFQYLFNSMRDQQDESHTIKVILKQKQQLTELKNTIQCLKTKEQENLNSWQKEKTQLLRELKELRAVNLMMKTEINRMTCEIKYQQKCQKFGEPMDSVKENQNSQNDKITKLGGTEEEAIVFRMISKVERLSKELQYFIDISHKFKNQAQKARQQLSAKVSQLEMTQKDLYLVTEALKDIELRFSDQNKTYRQREDHLNSQLNAYKDQYEVLRKRYFIMQSEFRKYSSDLSAREKQNFQDKYEVLAKQYNHLYESYKALYQDYINRSRQTDFVMELGNSSQKQIGGILQRISLQGSDFKQTQSIEYGKKGMVHLPQQGLWECSEIIAPIENVDQHRPLQCPYPKIILKDLIMETLMQCKGSN